ncbi:MAG: hypothetical protein GY730_11470 [bacterium]|nr:hypothetical protein [bacterium]
MNKLREKDKHASRSVTLKRTVTIKAVVTDKFKEYMKYELTNSVSGIKNRVAEIDKTLKELSDSKDKSGANAIAQKIRAEKFQLMQSLEDFKGKNKSVEDLKIDSHYVQGTVDGFVSVSEGDNLYEKLGGMEVVVKDGIVEELIPVADIKARLQEQQ